MNLRKFTHSPAGKSYIPTYLFIAALTIINGLYFSYRRGEFTKSEYCAQNGARVVSVISSDSSSGGSVLFYMFIVEHKSYKGEILADGDSASLSMLLLNRYFPVAYRRSDPNVNVLLLTPLQFKGVRLDFPDSLRWVVHGIKAEKERK